MKNTTRTAIYCRASTDKQTESTAAQLRACREKAKQLELTVTATYIDEAMSGARSDRPQYMALLQAAKDKKIDALLMFSQSRLGRDSQETEAAIRLLEFHGVRLVTLEGYDTASQPLKLRKMTRGMKGIMDEAYRDDLKEFTLNGLTQQALKSYWCGGRPYGYRLEVINDPVRKDAYGNPERIGSRLVKDKRQAPVVLSVFEQFADGLSPQAIGADLNARDVPSPGSSWKRVTRRCAGWSRSGIWQMLRNPLYSGTYYWKRAQWDWVERDVDGVKRKVRTVVARRAKDEWVGAEGNMPELRIVPPALWQRVQARLNQNKVQPSDKRKRSGGKRVYPLSGLLYCGDCGAHYVMDNNTHYSCARHHDGNACKNALRVRRDVAEQTILATITDRVLAPKVIDEMAAEMRRYYAAQMEKRRAIGAQLPAEIADIDARIERLRKRLKYGDDDMTADELQAVLDRAGEKRTALLNSQPAARQGAKVAVLLPQAAAAYRAQLLKGLAGHPAHAARAHTALRRLLGDRITLAPTKGPAGPHLVAKMAVQPAVLLTVGSVGSGGRI